MCVVFCCFCFVCVCVCVCVCVVVVVVVVCVCVCVAHHKYQQSSDVDPGHYWKKKKRRTHSVNQAIIRLNKHIKNMYPDLTPGKPETVFDNHKTICDKRMACCMENERKLIYL